MATKKEIIDNFDPNDVGVEGTLFGLPFDEATADLIIIPVPWEVTVSYGEGTASASIDILYASTQVDLYDPEIPDAWKMGIAMLDEDDEIFELNDTLREEAYEYIEWLSLGQPEQDNIPYLEEIPSIVNQEAKKLNNWVKETADFWLKQGKLVALLGGDHSTPLGLMQCLATRYDSFGILQIDAHADLRDSYEGFEFSHASIMFNALKIPQISKLVQVGIRDYCEEEAVLIEQSGGRVVTFFDKDIKEAQFEGKTWKAICDEIVSQLPENVYISFDIDGLDPKLCPNTGTPVPGGFELEQVYYLIKSVVKAGKKIISFDLVEVSADLESESEWNASVGARLLYKLCNWYGVSQGKLKSK